MKEYLYRGLVSSHPKVARIWEWGGTDIQEGSPICHYITVIFLDGDRKDFGGNINPDDTFKQCNEYLNTIPE